MPHNGFIYEARLDMIENSGHCLKRKREETEHLNIFILWCPFYHMDSFCVQEMHGDYHVTPIQTTQL